MNTRDSMAIYDHWSYMAMFGVLEVVFTALRRHDRYQNPDVDKKLRKFFVQREQPTRDEHSVCRQVHQAVCANSD